MRVADMMRKGIVQNDDILKDFGVDAIHDNPTATFFGRDHDGCQRTEHHVIEAVRMDDAFAIGLLRRPSDKAMGRAEGSHCCRQGLRSLGHVRLTAPHVQVCCHHREGVGNEKRSEWHNPHGHFVLEMLVWVHDQHLGKDGPQQTIQKDRHVQAQEHRPEQLFWVDK
jgi:hypothetical protein